MQFILALRHSIILAHNTLTLKTFMLGFFLTLLLLEQKDTSTGLLILGDPRDCISVKVGRYLRGCKYFDLIRSLLSIIFCLRGGQ